MLFSWHRKTEWSGKKKCRRERRRERTSYRSTINFFLRLLNLQPEVEEEEKFIHFRLLCFRYGLLRFLLVKAPSCGTEDSQHYYRVFRSSKPNFLLREVEESRHVLTKFAIFLRSTSEDIQHLRFQGT